MRRKTILAPYQRPRLQEAETERRVQLSAPRPLWFQSDTENPPQTGEKSVVAYTWPRETGWRAY